MLCKCKICKKRFETEAPSRIKDPVCAECLPEEIKRRIRETPAIPEDYEEAMEELREKFGECPNCTTVLTPLQSFKIDGKMYCNSCYSKIMEPRWRNMDF